VTATLLIMAAGVSLASAVIHFTLGLRRPGSPQHVTFALLMLVTCPFQLIVARFSVTTSIASTVALSRAGVATAIVMIALFGAFVAQYAGVKPRPYTFGFLAMSAMWLVYDLAAPRGLLYEPKAASLTISPIALSWQAFNALTVFWTTALGGLLVRRGRRHKGVLLLLGGGSILVTIIIDIVRNVLGRSWPYVGGFGLVVFSLLLAVDLAINFRENEQRLTEWVGTAIALRDQLNTPLQTLRFGLATMPAANAAEHARIQRLQRAVTRLRDLGRDLRARGPVQSSRRP
jgi:hypothetical protein